MGIVKNIGKWMFPADEKPPVKEIAVTSEDNAQPSAFGGGSLGGYGNYNPIFPMAFDGEKNLGEMGPIRQYFLNHYALRLRSRQLFIESEICHTVITRYCQWVIGRGLALKAEPKIEVLATEGINIIDTEVFNDNVERRWEVYASSKLADATGRMTLNELSSEAFIEKKIGGDMLVILTVVAGLVKVRHVDGAHILTPPTLSFDGVDYRAENGNRVRLGVEIDALGAHVAYYVRCGTILDYKRIEAYGKKSGMRMAILVTDKKYTVDSERAMPLIVAIMETAKRLERYNSATLGSAEERQKIAYFFQHATNSTNEDPQAALRAKAFAGYANVQADLPRDVNGDQLANRVAASTNKQVYNLPNDVEIKSMESKQELHVSEFSMLHIDLICATVGIPPNVAMSKYEDSFSASRMAGKDWEHTFMLERENFAQQYLQPIYALQMYVWVHSNKIQAPGYLTALTQKNEMAIAAYLYARWDGENFPDIDPLKTINYLRAATGPTLAHVPFMNAEAAAKYINQGEVKAIMKQTEKDLALAKKLGIEREDKLTGVPIENEQGGVAPVKKKNGKKAGGK